MTFLLQNTNVYSTAHSMELREWIGGRTLKNLSTTCRHDWELKFNWNSFTYQITPIQCHWHNNNECKNNHKILLIFLISIFNWSSIKKILREQFFFHSILRLVILMQNSFNCIHSQVSCDFARFRSCQLWWATRNSEKNDFSRSWTTHVYVWKRAEEKFSISNELIKRVEMKLSSLWMSRMKLILLMFYLHFTIMKPPPR